MLLAHAPDDIQHQILSGSLTTYTPNTLTDPEKLRELLAQIRQQGYHLAKEDVDFGAYSVATPIRDHSRSVIATLSVAGPCSRLNPKTQRLHTQEVVETASTISRELGWSEYDERSP